MSAKMLLPSCCVVNGINIDISENTAIGVGAQFDTKLQRLSGEFRDDRGATIRRLILGSIGQGAYQQAPNYRCVRSFADFQHVFAP